MFADGEMDRAPMRANHNDSAAGVQERTQQLAGLRGQTALGRYAGHVEESWNAMPIEDKRLILLAVVESITLGRATRDGSNHFDRERMTIHWNYESLARLSGNENDPAWHAEIAADRVN